MNVGVEETMIHLNIKMIIMRKGKHFKILYKAHNCLCLNGILEIQNEFAAQFYIF